jgi:predicted nucleotidyltransferase
MPLPDSFIQSALEKIDTPYVLGVGIVGSYAREQESRYSDVDFDILVNPLLPDRHRDVVNNTLSLIKEAGLS